jgi:hypothetical protein
MRQFREEEKLCGCGCNDRSTLQGTSYRIAQVINLRNTPGAETLFREQYGVFVRISREK